MSPTADSRGIRIDLHSTIAELRELKSPWLGLWQGSNPRHVFTHPGWQLAVATAYAGSREPHVLVARLADRIVGILPLVRDDGRLRFLGTPWADYNDVLIAPDVDSDAVLGTLLSHVAAAGGCVFENIRDDARLAALRGRTTFAGLRLRTRFRSKCPTVIAGPDTLEQLARKKSLLRHEKKLQRLGALTLQGIEDPATARRSLPGFFEQHSRRRAFTGEGIVFRDERAQRFVSALFDELPRGDVQLHVVECGGRPVAMHLGFISSGAFLWYKPAFDVDLWNLGPGEVLMRQLMLDAHRRGLAEFDFTIGEEDFKFRFANHARDAFEIQVLPAGLPGHLRSWRLDLRAAIDRRPRAKAFLRARVLPTLHAIADAKRHGLAGRKIRRRALAILSGAPGECALFRVGAGSSPGKASLRELALHDIADAALAAPAEWPPARTNAARKSMQRGRALGRFEQDRLTHVALLAEDLTFAVLPELARSPDPAALVELIEGVAAQTGARLVCDLRDEPTLAACGRAGFVRDGTRWPPRAAPVDESAD